MVLSLNADVFTLRESTKVIDAYVTYFQQITILS